MTRRELEQAQRDSDAWVGLGWLGKEILEIDRAAFEKLQEFAAEIHEQVTQRKARAS